MYKKRLRLTYEFCDDKDNFDVGREWLHYNWVGIPCLSRQPKTNTTYKTYTPREQGELAQKYMEGQIFLAPDLLKDLDIETDVNGCRVVIVLVDIQHTYLDDMKYKAYEYRSDYFWRLSTGRDGRKVYWCDTASMREVGGEIDLTELLCRRTTSDLW